MTLIDFGIRNDVADKSMQLHRVHVGKKSGLCGRTCSPREPTLFAASGNSVAPLGVGETAFRSAEHLPLSRRIRSGKTKLLWAEEEDGGEVSSRIRCVVA